MNTTTVILIVVGVVVAIFLTALCTWLWRKYQKRQEFKNKVRTIKNAKGKEDVYKAVNTIELPFSFRKVDGQTPALIITPQPSSNGASHHSKSGDSKSRQNSNSPLKSEHDFERKPTPNYKKQQSTISYPGAISQKTDPRQREISSHMLAHLSKQGKQANTSGAQNLSFNELKSLDDQEPFIVRSSSVCSDCSDTSTVSGISNFSGLSGASSLTSSSSYGYEEKEEGFDSLELGSSKKRMGTKRGNVKTKKTYKRSGKIIFTTEYSDEKKTLEVHILRLFDLISQKPTQEINPYVRVYLQPGKIQKYNTKYQKGTRNPYINEKIYFKNIEKSSFNRYKIRFKVYHFSRIKTNELLGEVELALSSLDTNAKETFNVDIFITREVKREPGQILISLCHQATFSKLEVIIQQAKNLQGSHLHTYATATLYDENGIQRKETTVKKSKNPEFNEVLDLTIYTNVSTPLDIFSLVISVNNKRKIGKDEIIGHVIFNTISPQQAAAEQWLKVKNEPHKRVSGWHTLIDPSDL